MNSDAPAPETLCLPFDEASVAEGARLIRVAVATIYEAKGRPSFNPLIVHVDSRNMAESLANFCDTARILADAFWPGPLTIILPRRSAGGICDLATAGLETVALRMPDHPAMRTLIAASGVPLAAPSANRSGSISPTQAAHVIASLGGRIPLVIDAGPCRQGLESTIVQPVEGGCAILRPGPVTPAMIAAAGIAVVEVGRGEGITAPGQLASHYCPAKLLMLNVTAAALGSYLIGFGPMDCDANLSATGDLTEAAANLFALLHRADASDANAIAVAPIPQDGLGIAINDRLARAAVR